MAFLSIFKQWHYSYPFSESYGFCCILCQLSKGARTPVSSRSTRRFRFNSLFIWKCIKIWFRSKWSYFHWWLGWRISFNKLLVSVPPFKLSFSSKRNITFISRSWLHSGHPKVKILRVDSSHFIFEINVGKRRIWHRTTLDLNDLIFNRFWVDLEIQFQSRSISDPPPSDIDFKSKMAWIWTTLNYYVLHNSKISKYSVKIHG